jgi:hypothetical protein
MLTLSKYDLSAQEWVDETFAYPHTLAEIMFPNVDFTIVHAEGMDARKMVLSLPDGYDLDFATGAKKKGDFIASSDPVAPIFWNTSEEAVAYGSILLTPCWGHKPVEIQLNVAVVEDGEFGTGDCHAKCSTGLYDLLDADEDRVGQFRLGLKDEGIIAKGTMMLDSLEEGDEWVDMGIDMVIPQSAFKSSHKPDTGMYTWDVVLGIVTWSEALPYRIGWQVLQWFSWSTVEAELLPSVELMADDLVEVMSDTRSLVELLRLDATEFEMPILDIFEANKHGLLNQHPYLVWKIGQMVQRKWSELALGAGQKWTGLMAIPNDELPDGVIATNEVRKGEVIVMRFPLRSWEDLQVWENVGLEGSHRGVVAMNHKTAAQMGGDYDGDAFVVTPAEKYPLMTAEIRSWANRPKVPVLKVKDRKASPMDQVNLARVMLDNTDNMVGQVAFLVARAIVANRLDLVPQLAQELQIAVDKFKYNVEHNTKFLAELSKRLYKPTWLKDYKESDVFRLRHMRVGQNQGTIGELCRRVNARWQHPDVLSLPLSEFDGIIPEADEAYLDEARQLNILYAQLVAAAIAADDEGESFSRLMGWIREWAESHPEPKEMAKALWHVVHSKRSNGRGSLAFVAFPAEIAEMLADATLPTPDKVAIVGVKRNAHKDNLAQFDGSPKNVQFVLRPLGE